MLCVWKSYYIYDDMIVKKHPSYLLSFYVEIDIHHIKGKA